MFSLLLLEIEERVCIGEQIVPFKGRLDIKQYVKGKPHPWGVNVFMLCGESALVFDFRIYQSSTTKLNENEKLWYGVTARSFFAPG